MQCVLLWGVLNRNRKAKTQYYMIMNMLQPKALNHWFSQWGPGTSRGPWGRFRRFPAKINPVMSLKFFHKFHNHICVWLFWVSYSFCKKKKKTSHSIIPLRWGLGCTQFKIHILVMANVVNWAFKWPCSRGAWCVHWQTCWWDSWFLCM